MRCSPMSRSRRSKHYGWLKPGEMLDGLGMAETTPGPLIMVLQFVGFMAAYRDPGSLSPMLAGTLGGLLATWVTFTPCFLWIFLGAPFIEVLRGNRALQRRALRHHRRGRRRRAQSRDLVRDPHDLSRDRAGRAFPFSFDAPSARERRPWCVGALDRRRHRHLSVQGRHDPDARGCCARRTGAVTSRECSHDGRAGAPKPEASRNRSG